ncbi:MAG: peroxiredoxin [Armatimonadetes bacterium]|nr:peroxiredoxin [Armatimonadota bacterium]
MPEVGDKAPAFASLDTQGEPITLDEFAGRTLVLYFYPKDSTPGCTIEAQNFRDKHAEFAALNAVIVGVSRDTVKSHQKFAANQCLPFRLLADTDESVCHAYDVIAEKSFMGRIGLGVIRTTYVIGPDGTIRAKFAKVAVKGHVDEVLTAVSEVAQAT